MNITTSSIVLFSPTGTSRKVATAVADGCRCAARVVDVTCARPTSLSFSTEHLVFMALPVYGGHIAPLALQRLDRMSGQDTPIVLIALYGNRAYEEALDELYIFVRQRGFIPIAAAAFVGEHSYSTPDTPIAAGRPDRIDLDFARAWGRDIRDKLDRADRVYPIDIVRLNAPFTSPLARLRFVSFIAEQRNNPVKPVVEVDTEKCKLCGKCARVCPSKAITLDSKLHINTDLCIKCCACVKFCPAKALSFDTPYAPVLSKLFDKRKPPVTVL